MSRVLLQQVQRRLRHSRMWRLGLPVLAFVVLSLFTGRDAFAISGGSYEIDSSVSTGTSTTYKDFTSFLSDIKSGTRSDGGTSNGSGLTGDVYVTVKKGTYAGRLNFSSISGLTGSYKLVFDGGAGNRDSRIIYYQATTSDAYCIRIDGLQNITFRNMTFNLNGNSYYYATTVHLVNALKNNTFAQCRIVLDNITKGWYPNNGIMYNGWADVQYYYNGGYGASNNAFDTCLVTGTGLYHGAYLYGTSSTPYAAGFKFRGTEIYQSGRAGIYCYYISGSTIQNCKITADANYGDRGIYLEYCYMNSGEHYDIQNNYVEAPYYAFYDNSSYGGTGTGSNAGYVFNNIFTNGNNSQTGGSVMYTQYNYYWNYYHNTIVRSNISSYTGYLGYMYYTYYSEFRNNLLQSTVQNTSGYPFYAYGTNFNTFSYNTFWVPNSTPSVYFYHYYNFYDYSTISSMGSNNKFVEQNIISATNPRLIDGCGNKGDDLTAYVPKDIDGQTRATTPNVGADEFAAIADNMKAMTILSPTVPLSSTTPTVSVRLKNVGNNTISSGTVKYSLNGGTAVSTSLGASVNVCNTIDVTFPSSMTIASGVNTLKVWHEGPNGNADGDRSNDTLTMTFCAPVSGAISVDPTATPSATTFNTIQAALNYLYCGGINGAVTVNIAAGTYNEKLLIGKIPGASASNNITFKGVDSATTIIRASDMNYVVKLDNASYITLTKLAILNTTNSTSSTYALHMTNNSDYNKITNCRIGFTNFASSGNDASIGLCGSTPYVDGGCDNNLIQNTITKRGYFGIMVYGNGSTYGYKNRIENNVVDSFYYYGVGAYYQDSMMIKGNTAVTSYSNYGYAFYLQILRDIQIISNRGESGYGLYWYNGWLGPRSVNRLYSNIFINRAAASGYTAGYLNWVSGADVFNNTFISLSSGSYAFYSSYNQNMNVRNNIIHNEHSSGYAWYDYQNSGVLTGYLSLDYNVFYSANTSTTNGLGQIQGTYYGKLADVVPLASGAYNQNSIDKQTTFATSPSNGYLDNTVFAEFGPSIPEVTTDVDGEVRCSFAPTIGADESKYVVVAPNPIVAPDTVYVGSATTLLGNLPKGFPAIGEWDMNNDGSIEANGPTAELTFNNLGRDSVKFTIRTCNGSKSVVKYVEVVNPTNAPSTDFISDKNTITANEEVFFTNLTGNGPTSFNWSVTPSNGVTIFNSNTDKNVSMIFDYGGTYEVCLEATNSIGAVVKCKSKYITVVEEGFLCGSMDTKAPTGFLYDIGGPSLSYSKTGSGVKSYCGYLIDPCATEVSMKFKSFALDPNNWGGTYGMDSLVLFDGENNQAPVIAAFSQNNPPTIGNPYKATSGKMFVQFMNANNCWGCTAAGFSAEWNSVAATIPAPILTLDIPDTVYLDIDFLTTASVQEAAGNVLYSWDINNDGSWEYEGDPYNENYFYYDAADYPSTPTTVQFTVKAVGCGGETTVTKDVVVTQPTNLPRVDFVADLTNASKSDVVTFKALTDASVYGWDWVIYPEGKIIEKTGGYSSSEYGVQFTDTGYYTVRLMASNSVGDDSLVKTAYIHIFDYCTPDANNLNADIGINKVQIGTINHSSNSGVNGYNDFTFKKAELELGASYTLTVSRTTALNNLNYKAWLDMNFDGQFSTSEEVLNSGVISGNSAANTFTIPASGAAGATRLRVAASYGSMPNLPCGPNQFGEYEDYRIILRPDQTPPVITLIGADTVYNEMGYPYTDGGATAEDNLDGVITSSLVATDGVNIMALGTYNYSYDVSDSRGNAAKTKHRVVIITPDVTAPGITMFGSDTTVEVNATYTDAGAVAIDLVDGNLTSGMNVVNGVNTAALDTYYVDYSVADSKGNMATAKRRVIVADLSAPVVTINDAATRNPDTVEVNTTYNDPGANVSDNFYSGVGYTTSGLDMTVLGTYTLEYKAVDGSGNTGTATRTVVVVDRTAPVITLKGDTDVYVDVFDSYTDPGETVSDNYWPGLTATKVGSPNFSVVGDYDVTYSAVDGSSNAAIQVVRTIHVVDREAPVLTLNGAPVVNSMRWLPYTDAGVSVSDNYYTGMTATSTSTVDVNSVGAYYVTWKLTDPSGNKATDVTRIVYIMENTTGIKKEELESAISVYPNPTTGIININTELSKDVTVTVINSLGELIAQKNLAANGNQTIDISNYAAGLYMIRVSVDGQTVVKPINLVK